MWWPSQLEVIVELVSVLNPVSCCAEIVRLRSPSLRGAMALLKGALLSIITLLAVSSAPAMARSPSTARSAGTLRAAMGWMPAPEEWRPGMAKGCHCDLILGRGTFLQRVWWAMAGREQEPATPSCVRWCSSSSGRAVLAAGPEDVETKDRDAATQGKEKQVGVGSVPPEMLASLPDGPLRFDL